MRNELIKSYLPVLKSFALLCSVIFMISCKFEITQTPASLIKANDWDSKNIPDSRNCGADESVTFIKVTDSQEIYPDATVLFRTDTNQFMLSSYKAPNLPQKFSVSNYDFSDHPFVTNGMDRYTETKYITFENCKFNSFRNDAVSSDSKGKVYFIFNNCSFSGGVNSSYITLNNCKIGGFTSDGMNPLREFYATNLYVYDLEHEANENGIHIDGIQIYGNQRSRQNVVNDKWVSQVETGKIQFDNVRFEIPSIHFENTKSYVNACVMFQLEFSDVDNVSFKNLYVNGGGKWYPLYMDSGKNNERSKNGKSWSHKNLVMKNVMVSNNFGTIFYPDLLEDAKITNVDHHDYLFVTSVWKDENGTAHFLVTNDTNSDKTLIVKSNVGTVEYTIPHCPSNWALGGEIDTKTNPDESLTDTNGRAYTTYSFDDLPFDKEYTLDGDPDFILCYQKLQNSDDAVEEQIRYVNFTGKNHHYKEICQ